MTPLLRVIPWLLVGLSVAGMSLRAVGAGPTGADARGLDPAFARWAQSARQPAYAEINRRFLAAAGRDAAAYGQAIDTLREGFQVYCTEHAAGETASERMDTLRKFIFERQRFEADLDLVDLENLFPDAILARRRGFCLGLSLVLVEIGEQVDWPLRIASAPRHAFVRYPATPPVNLETTLGGEIHDDAWYRARYDLGSAPKSLIRTLTPRETAAHLVNNYGFALLEKGHLDAAKKEFDTALGLARDLVEARINLGVLAARKKDYAAALSSFEAALAAWPNDPTLQLNRANTLIQLGRPGDALTQIQTIGATFPQLPGLDRARAQLEEILRADVEDPTNWKLLQTLVTDRNAITARRGKPPGLRGSYYRDAKLDDRVWERVDRDISFQWSWSSPGRKIPRDHFSVRWQGWLEIPESDEYTFFVTLSDGIRIWLDGRQVLNSWRRANDSFPKASIHLEPGLHDFRVDYFESVGEAGISIILTAEKKEKPLRFSRHIFHPKP